MTVRRSRGGGVFAAFGFIVALVTGGVTAGALWVMLGSPQMRVYRLASGAFERVEFASPGLPESVIPEVSSQSAGSGAMAYEQTAVTCGTLDDRPVVLVWSDVAGQPAARVSVSPTSLRYSGSATGDRGGRVEWECLTTDGQNGTVRVGELEFSLADGALFLVQTAGAIRVLQVKTPLPETSPTAETLRSLAAENQQVQEFLAAVKTR